MTTKKVTVTVILHVIFASVLYYILWYFFIFDLSPNDNNLLNFDGLWYKSIRDNGYIFVPRKGCNLAFFPLFSFFWKALCVSPVWISIINLITFVIAFVFLVRQENLSYSLIMFLISIPSFIFFAVPYSESLFFLFTSMIIIGYKKNNSVLKNIGFLGSSLVRSVCLLFVPSIIFCELFFHDGQTTIRTRIINAIYSLTFCLIGLTISVFIQYYQTGKVFYFLTVQKYWQRTWIIPKIPLTTFSAVHVIGTDSIAFMIGCIAIIFCLIWASSLFKKNKQVYLTLRKTDKSIVFSILYLAGITIMDTFFTLNYHDGGNIWSINRHILSTPFSFIFIIWIAKEHKADLKEILFSLAVVGIGLYLAGSYRYFLMGLQYSLFFLIIIIFRYFPMYKNYFFLVYLFAVFLQVSFYHGFLNGEWLG